MTHNPYYRFCLLSLALIFLLAACFTANIPPAVSESLTGAKSVPTHPLSIATLRERTFEGSDLVVEQTLDPGVNYNRYIVSYQSDGLKIYALLTVPWAQKPTTG